MNKEELKKLRKEAYERAKKARETDEEYNILKQKLKEKQKAMRALWRQELKEKKEQERLEKQKVKDEALALQAGLLPQLRLLKF